MKTKLFFATIVATLASGGVIADGAALYAEKTCIACHGKEGKKPMTPTFPKLAGQNAAYMEQQMRGDNPGARPTDHRQREGRSRGQAEAGVVVKLGGSEEAGSGSYFGHGCLG